jgi:hypothetical protein
MEALDSKDLYHLVAATILNFYINAVISCAGWTCILLYSAVQLNSNDEIYNQYFTTSIEKESTCFCSFSSENSHYPEKHA